MNQPSSDVHYKKFLRKKMSAIQMNSPSPVNSCSRSLNVAATTMFPLFKISYKCRELSTFLAKDLLKVSSTFTKYMNPPPGGGGYSTNVYTGRLRPEVQPLTLLYTIFHKKGTPFVYILLTNVTPFTYLVKTFVSLQ